MAVLHVCFKGDITGLSDAFLYDAEGRICAAGNGSNGYGYLYDAASNRVAKGTITSWSCDMTMNGFTPLTGYVVGSSGEQLTEVALNNGNAWAHTNVYANGKLIGTYDSQGEHFHFDDPLGTRRAQASADGTLEAVYESLPFGDGYAWNSIRSGDPTENHFTGKERDTESGNDYMFARYYNSATGRFLSPDWSAKEEPVPYAKLSNPQSLNLYAYMFNNPLGGVDADGHGCGGPNEAPCPAAAPAQQSVSADLKDAKNEVIHALTTKDGAEKALKAFQDSPASLVVGGAEAEGVTAAAGRVEQLAGAMGKTKNFVTLAITETKEGISVVSSSENALRPAVKAMLGEGEVAATGAGHAEVTGVNAAKESGLTPTGVAASRPICASCAEFLRGVGASILSALK